MDKHPVLTIAGFDPLNSAGVTLDLHVLENFGFKAFAVVTAILPQSPEEVLSVHRLNRELIEEQLRPLLEEEISGLKVSIAAEAIPLLPQLCVKIKGPKVFDPIVRAGGKKVMTEEERSFLEKEVFPLFDLITPNLEEAFYFLRKEEKDLRKTLILLAERWNTSVLLKGGHTPEKKDLLFFQGRIYEFPPGRLFPFELHGTGCLLSSSILAYLIKGHSLPEAVEKGKSIIEKTFESSFSPGKGKSLIFLKVDL